MVVSAGMQTMTVRAVLVLVDTAGYSLRRMRAGGMNTGAVAKGLLWTTPRRTPADPGTGGLKMCSRGRASRRWRRTVLEQIDVLGTVASLPDSQSRAGNSRRGCDLRC
ncbi:hypothetical protein Pma05_11580 [Plantactinospora mayteni]|uniref:Uncharacterized protein n=1 Tax=Plantactinospora mayteni TaxID=566021 RepID=A0ABQ4EIL1_9ACTN|nr:hypothetical protein Pma05_11580 [Plantactinospora mayteni]